jgi:hypothetical protein
MGFAYNKILNSSKGMNLFEVVYEKDYLTPPSWHVFDIKMKTIDYVLERMESQKELIFKKMEILQAKTKTYVIQNKNFKKFEL